MELLTQLFLWDLGRLIVKNASKCFCKASVKNLSNSCPPDKNHGYSPVITGRCAENSPKVPVHRSEVYLRHSWSQTSKQRSSGSARWSPASWKWGAGSFRNHLLLLPIFPYPPLCRFKYSILRKLSFIGMSARIYYGLTIVLQLKRAAQPVYPHVIKSAVPVAKCQTGITSFLRWNRKKGVIVKNVPCKRITFSSTSPIYWK